ncbi:hypothetical protein DZC78_12390 [Olleya aquimaris]|uniref:Tetratricopeptide repeat protein n=1 Tax=Olleya sediminilitoris TaxID=2795739 RepID=A0ABS1WIY1_9FLAO|nr:hypothetical protein [Olleya sediminilitoris]AXO81149.1 hypothetical protein DZC78_12390 [Olleya aquimaris]MBL7559069.1 hypothetical protein [Olleya sediminilitoris]
MRTKITLLIALMFGLNFGFAQNTEECMTKLSLMSEASKAKNYEAAYQPFMDLRKDCPKYNKAIYVYGEKILNHYIDKAAGADKLAYVKDLLSMYDERLVHFESQTKVGDMISDKAQLMYKYKTELGLSNEEVYNTFDKAYTTDLKTFKNPKALYTYFSLMVDLFDAGKKTDQELFDKYDDVVDKIETEVKISSEGLNKLIAKEEAGTALTKKDKQYKKYYESSLKVFDQIVGSVDSKLGDRANCQNLIPLYQKDYEANKNNTVWLQRAMNKLYEKGCKTDPMFVKILNQKNTIEPNADTAYYLYINTGEQRYLDQTMQLETDPIKKAKLTKKIGLDFYKSGSYGKARQYFQQALSLNPSDKKPHEYISRSYAASANSCGDTNFNKRAVFWLAATEARKAGNTALANSYQAKAPTKSEIFSAGNAGQTIKIGCWIGRSVTVPSL